LPSDDRNGKAVGAGIRVEFAESADRGIFVIVRAD
jgi:hypothetical protein